jgi:hypothetical protein
LNLPSGESKERSKQWEDAKRTSATDGARRGVSWPRAGLVKFNELSEMVKKQREADEVAENKVEAELMACCQAEAGTPEVANGGDNKSSEVVPNKMESEDEVEAVGGERSVFEVWQM